MGNLKKLFDKNRLWIDKKIKKDPEFFFKTSSTQNPKYLWIGCSDSRILPNEITGLGIGELFVHRNIGNLFLPGDLNAEAVLEYSVDVLKVEHVIVCGHYGCGGIETAMEGGDKLAIWLSSIRELIDKNREELEEIKDYNLRLNRLVELNVKEQVLNISSSLIVQKAWKRRQNLTIYGLVYDLKSGRLKDLGCSVFKDR